MSQRDELIRLARKGWSVEQGRKAMRGCLGRLAFITGCCLFRALWLMLAVDVIRAYWLPSVPALGYGWAFLIVALLSGVFSDFPQTKTTKEVSNVG
jgi:hypothetical protein